MPSGEKHIFILFKLRDFTAELLTERCRGVSIEPLTGESLTYSTANRDDYARLDVIRRVTAFRGYIVVGPDAPLNCPPRMHGPRSGVK